MKLTPAVLTRLQDIELQWLANNAVSELGRRRRQGPGNEHYHAAIRGAQRALGELERFHELGTIPDPVVRQIPPLDPDAPEFLRRAGAPA